MLSIFSCKEESALRFSEKAYASSDSTEIEIIYPEVDGKDDVATAINAIIRDHMVNAISFSEEPLKGVSLKEAVQKFNEEYKRFIEEFPESDQKWYASIEGEVTYQSPEIISIAMNSYLDTGGAHGNDNITFFNFNPKTGAQFNNEALLEQNQELNVLVKRYLEKEVVSENSSMDDYFFGESFHLPANIGFSDEGVVFLYNVYEIAAYNRGYTEFVIPFAELDEFLKVE